MPENTVTKPEPKRSLRMQRREERMKLARKLTEVTRVRVSPANERMRRVIRHPRFGGFRSSGSIELPLDTWLKRRIKEGSVVLESAQQARKRQEARQAPRATATSKPATTPST